MVRWVIGSILHGGPIELFLVPSSAPRLLSEWSFTLYLTPRLWDDAYKKTLAVISERVVYVVAAGFFSCYLSGPLPYA